MFFEKMLLSIAIICMSLGGLFWFRNPTVFPQEKSSSNAAVLNKLSKSFSAEVLFDSNRSGRFGVYRQALDGSAPEIVIDTELHEMFPDPSANGELVVFARHTALDRGNQGEIWLVNSDGTQERKLADNGTFPTFSADGSTVYFERDRKKVMAVPTSGGEAKEVFPAQFSQWNAYYVVKPRISKDGRFVYFTTDRSGRWNAYFANLETGEAGHVGRGCEPVPFEEPDKVAWITKSHVLSKSGIGLLQKSSGERTSLQDAGPPYGHEYFPTVAKGDRFLLYSACPGSQHDHYSANYQIFIRDLQSNDVARLSHDTFTNRWPKLLPRK